MESKNRSNKSIEEYALIENFADAPGSVENFAIGLSDAEYEGVWQWSSAMDDDSSINKGTSRACTLVSPSNVLKESLLGATWHLGHRWRH